MKRKGIMLIVGKASRIYKTRQRIFVGLDQGYISKINHKKGLIWFRCTRRFKTAAVKNARGCKKSR